MFCPICRTEYREGFTTCSDCQVPLVGELPLPNAPHAFTVLWSEENPARTDRLLDELENAKINAFRVPFEVLARNSADLFGLGRGLRVRFAVCVRLVDLPAANLILKSFLEQDSSSLEVPPDSIPFSENMTELPPDLPLHWNPAVATVEVWTGEEQDRASFIRDSLHGVGVPTRLTRGDKGLFRLMVRPEDETKGHDIVRQIADNAAPEEFQLGKLGTLWLDDPIVSYAFLWIVVAVDLLLLILGVFASPTSHQYTGPIAAAGALISSASYIGQLWMLYQAIRYEIYPLRFILISFLPLSFVWYHFERYAKRHGIHRLPVAVRLRMSPPPSA